MSQEERIRRAEEIYNRRVNSRNYATYKNKEVKIDSAKGKKNIAKKMIIQIAMCSAIYFVMFLINNANSLFSTDFRNKTREILSYDISIENVKSIFNTYFTDLQNKLNSINSSENVVLNTEQQETNTQSMGGSESPEDLGQTEKTAETEGLENNSSTEDKKESQDTNEQEENTETKSENNSQNDNSSEEQQEEKTQEQIDIEYVKQNLNIIWPLNGTITSGFGARTPTDIVSAYHYGIDIGGNTGDEIIAAADGTVTLASSEGDYGNHLKIENGEITTLYAHCSKLLVGEGTYVRQGEKIAEVGATGRATGPHLHFEIRRGDRFINPEEILG